MLTIRASPTGAAAIDDRRKEDLLILTIITVSRPGDKRRLYRCFDTHYVDYTDLSIFIYQTISTEASSHFVGTMHVSSKRFHFPPIEKIKRVIE